MEMTAQEQAVLEHLYQKAIEQINEQGFINMITGEYIMLTLSNLAYLRKKKIEGEYEQKNN